jgi:hypothetical protein
MILRITQLGLGSFVPLAIQVGCLNLLDLLAK